MEVGIQFIEDAANLELVQAAREGLCEPAQQFKFHLLAERLSLLEGFEELLCLPALRGVERLSHQEKTALQAMRRMRGRAILGDEVGLGKTVEAGLILKEYTVRGLVRRTLVLCPPSLLEQWRHELRVKFGMDFTLSTDPEFKAMGTGAWSFFDRVIASLPLARRSTHREALKATSYDLVIVDEAHHLRRRTSAAWRLVHDLPRKFLLLLTATPVQNELLELYNLITLLRPGQLGTPREFRARFVHPDDPRKPRNVSALRELMLDVMVRNTRASVQVQLPPRRARTVRLKASRAEKALLEEVRRLVRDAWQDKRHNRMALSTLLLESGSSPASLAPTLEKLGHKDLARRAAQLQLGIKAEALLEILRAAGEPTLVFSRFRATLKALSAFLRGHGMIVHEYHGGLTPQRREEELRRFASQGGVLLLSEVGGEGKNLQFCRHLVNFDLPWNPMRIEQRVGRLHRLGQTRPIEIVNLCLKDSLEDRLLQILDEKLNLFELVVGELATILGALQEEGDLEEVLFELSAGARDDDDLERLMKELEQQLLGLRQDHDESVRHDAELFGRDFEVED